MVAITSSVYRGPSVYSRRPIIRYTLGLTSAETLARGFDRTFVDSLLTFLPGLRDHRDTCDAPGVLERGIRAGEQQSLYRLFEHVCIELQNLGGVDLHCVRTDGGRGIAATDAVVPYEDERVAIEAGRLALAMLLADPPDFERRVAAFRALAERQALPIQDRAIVRAARARDIPVLPIAGRFIQLGHGRHQQRVSGTETTRTNTIGNKLAANKDYARRVFRAAGLPVPPYERVYRERDAVTAARRICFPVVLKPNQGNMGQGVSVGVKTVREVRDAYKRARAFDRSVIVEQFIPGADYRMLVIDGELRAVAKRVPAHVVGDGVHTIDELVLEANRDPRRGTGAHNSWTRLEFDEQSDRLLAERGYQRDSVARHGEIVYLRRNANTSAGGTAVDVTDQVHPQNRDIAVRAATSIGLDIAGVDVLVRDIALPMRAQGGVICEINSRPGIRKHMWPAEGRPRDVIRPILDMLFPPGTPSRIPIAAMIGSGRSTTLTARLLTHLLSSDGTTVGLAAGNGVFIDGRRMDGGGLDGPAATRMLLFDPAVQAAVVELSPADVVRNGLGYDWCDACAVINDDEVDPPGLADALHLVVDATRRSVVLSDDDERCRAVQPGADAEVWYVSTNGELPAVTNPRSVALENGSDGASICLRSGESTARISLARDGAWAAADPEQGARSALYAVTLALCLGRRPEDVERALRTFPAAYCG